MTHHNDFFTKNRVKTALLGMLVWRLSRHRVSIVLFTEVICRIRSDLLYMGRGELRRDQHTILVPAGRMRSAGTGAAKPNAMMREVQATNLSAGFGDLRWGRVTWKRR